MFPIHDDNPTHQTPFVTIALIVINVLAFLYELSLDSQEMLNAFIRMWGVVPAQLVGDFGSEFLTLFSSMFLHGGWLHLGGNMLYLWIFGNNVEDRLGHFRYIIFYLLAGLLASAAQVFIDPSETLPNIGASGAIAGVMGAYILEWPRARVATAVIFFYFLRIIYIPALIVLGIWFILQFFNGVAGLTDVSAEAVGGVAFFAHIGGFVAGLLLMKPFQIGRPEHARYT